METAATGRRSSFQIRFDHNEGIGTVREHSRAKAFGREEEPIGLPPNRRVGGPSRCGAACKRGLATILLIVLTGAPFPAAAQTRPPSIIDCHVHYNGDPAFLQKLLDKLDSVNGMAFLIVTPVQIKTAEPFLHQHPDRLVGLGSIDPDDPQAIEQIDQFHSLGFRGLGELENPRKDYNDPAYWPIYARAEKYRMIVLFHTGISARNTPNIPADVSVDRQRVTSLDGIARHFPGLTLIGAHMGNPEYAFAAEIGRWNPNLYFDLSGSSLIKLQNNYAIFRSIFWWSGVQSPHTPKSSASAFEKLVFGSDVFEGDLPEFDRALARYHKMLDACDVPAQAQQNIFSGTLWRVLHSTVR